MREPAIYPFFWPKAGPRIYLSGPMSGIENNNYDAFDEAAAILREDGYSVCSPADTSRFLKAELGEMRHEDYLRFDFERVLEAQEVIVLDGWKRSLGARAEVHMALRLGLDVWRWSPPPLLTMFTPANAVSYKDLIEAYALEASTIMEVVN